MSTNEIALTPELITTAKQRRLAARQASTPLQAVVALASMQKQPPGVLNTVTRGERVTLIGQIRQADIYDPVTAALRYARDGIDAIALFTDDDVYSKGMDDLTLVTRGLDRPVLYQDYLLSEYHVAEARAAGAAAVIAWASLLERDTLRRVVSAAQRWRMTTILQVADADDLAYAPVLSPHVIAIGGHVDFDPLLDLDLLARLREDIPYNTRVMPLGCIHDADTLDAVLQTGVDAVIVGEALAGNARRIARTRELLDAADEDQAGA